MRDWIGFWKINLDSELFKKFEGILMDLLLRIEVFVVVVEIFLRKFDLK
mgnify:FL=1